MSVRLSAVALIVALGVHLPVVAQAPRKEGNWEITVQVEMEGATHQARTRTTTQCVSAEEAADQEKPLPQVVNMPTSCTASDHKVDGNKVSWSFKCDLPDPMSGTGEIVYTDENAYAGAIIFTREGKTMTIKYSGKRLGDCTK